MELLDYFDGDELAASTWQKKYAAEGELTPDDMHKRMAKEFGRIESNFELKRDHSKDEFLSTYGKTRNVLTEESIYELFKDFKYVIPGGSTMATLGTNTLSSLSSCFFIGSPKDTITSIFDTCNTQAQVMKYRGGIGIDISTLRPSGSIVANSAKTSSGAASFMELFSTVTNTIGENNRRGAAIITMDVRHPDILEFIEKKQDLTKVTGANVSVKVTNEFMEAVEKDREYFLRYPVDLPDSLIRLYSLENYELNTLEEINQGFVKKVRARELWNKLIHCAWKSAEPGILFWDNIIDYSPDGIYEDYMPKGVNPCFTENCKILTIRGYMTFKEAFDSYRENGIFRVITPSGKPIKAKISYSGVKPVIHITLSTGRRIWCTKDHIFILSDGTECPAMHLIGKTLKGYKYNNESSEADPFVTRIADGKREYDVYDFTIEEGEEHLGVVEGVVVHNCGEQTLAYMDSCRLLHLNLTSFIDNPFTKDAKINFRKLYEVSYEAIRIGDDLIELEKEAIDKIIEKLLKDSTEDSRNIDMWSKIRAIGQSGRRIGCGFTGLADALAMLGLPYNINESAPSDNPTSEAISTIMSVMLGAQLQSTIDLAIERGSFEKWQPNIHLGTNTWYKTIQQLYPEIYNRMQTYGMRNVSFSTCAPTGTVSILAGCSSGVEPLFSPYYIRRRKCMSDKDRADYVDIKGEKYTEFLVIHPMIKRYLKTKFPFLSKEELQEKLADKEYIDELIYRSPWSKSIAGNINPYARVKIQALIQQYITSSISSTVNLPKDTSEETISNIYLKAWKTRCKGITVYRDQSREGILNTIDSIDNKSKDTNRQAPKRPKDLEADYHEVKVNGERFIVLVGLYNGKPYEIFTFRDKLDRPIKSHKGILTKIKKRCYEFKSEFIHIENLESASINIEENAATLYTSALLRHGVNINFIIKTAKKVNTNITSFSSAMCRILAKYTEISEVKDELCPECNSTLIRENSCLICHNCGWSKCM